MNSALLLFAIPSMFLLGALISVLPAPRRLAAVATPLLSAASLVFALAVTAHVLRAGSGPGTGGGAAYRLEAIPNWIAIDGFGSLLLLLITFVAVLASLFSLGYMRARARDRSDMALRLYHVNFNLFLFSIVTVPMMEEVALAWIAVELTTLLSVMLVAFENTREALEAAWKYVILTMVGAAIALLGIIVLFRALAQSGGGPFTWTALRHAGPSLSPLLTAGGFLLILVGFGVKVGLAPLHTWLPDAHSQAPSPVCAILSGVETSTILFVVLRLFPAVAAHPQFHLQSWAVTFGLISVGTAAFLLIQVRDLKRLFAFSTVEQMGIILTAAGLSSTNPAIVPYQLFTHALAKPLCFFAAGAILVSLGTRDIRSLRGIIRREPVAGAGLLIGALAVTGAPPFALFLSELSIFRAGIASGSYVAVGLLLLFIIVAFAAVLFHVGGVVFGHPPETLPPAATRVPLSSLAAIGLAMVPVLLFGVWVPGPISDLLRMAGAAISGGSL